MTSGIVHSPLFQGLTREQLADVSEHMRPRHFEPGSAICHAGDPGNSLFVVERGLAHVIPPGGEMSVPIARLRRGDVIGEMSLVTGEPRSATVVAAVPTDTLELGQAGFAEILSLHPRVLANLNRILSERLARTTVRHARRQRGEAVALLADDGGSVLIPEIVAATAAASPHPVADLDIRDPHDLSLDGALSMLDDLLSSHETVVVSAALGGEEAVLLAEQVDRVIVLGGEESLNRFTVPNAETVLIRDGSPSYGEQGAAIRTVSLADRKRDIDWIGRHLSRTKLGLALGAGGAKGYAHIGAIGVLERAGYTVDYVSGSSIGAFVGTWLAMGQSATAIEDSMRWAFRPEIVTALFSLSMSGLSTGIDAVTRVCQETTHGGTFADLTIPHTVMCVDLVSKQPAPITEGVLWEALLAAISLAGLFPPYERNGSRLVDGLALVPVPTGSVLDAGADITVSCNIMSRDTLPVWPGDQPAQEEAPTRARMRMLDTLLEVMDLSQVDSSIRHAAQADVVITPRFGPSTWRDFSLADRFLAAGREAAAGQIPALRAIARPQGT